MTDKPKRKNITAHVLKAVDNEILTRWSKRPMQFNDPLQLPAFFALNLRRADKRDSDLVEHLRESAVPRDELIRRLFDNESKEGAS